MVLYDSSQRLAHGCRNVEAYGLGKRSLGGRYSYATIRDTTIICRADSAARSAYLSGVPRSGIIQSAYHSYQQSREVDPAQTYFSRAPRALERLRALDDSCFSPSLVGGSWCDALVGYLSFYFIFILRLPVQRGDSCGRPSVAARPGRVDRPQLDLSIFVDGG